MTVSIEQAQLKLAELVNRTRGGEEIVITQNGRSVAKIVADPGQAITPKLGFAKGKLRIISEDEDHLKDFAEYMQ